MFSAATPVLLIQGEGKVRLVEMVGINKQYLRQKSFRISMNFPDFCGLESFITY